MKTIIILITSLFILACSEEIGNKKENSGLSHLSVEFADISDLKNADKQSFKVSLNIKAINFDGTINKETNSAVKISLLNSTFKPGSLRETKLKNGIAENVEITFQYPAEKERIAVELVDTTEDENGNITYIPKGIVGVSEVIEFPLATINTIQKYKKPGTATSSYYNKRNINLVSTDENPLVVTAIVEGGFCLKQMGLMPDEYSSIYLYTLSSPYVEDKGVPKMLEVGTIIDSVNGSINDFYGFNELSFPTYKPRKDNSGAIVKLAAEKMPKPFDITNIIGNDAELEKHEAEIVEIKNAGVSYFPENDESFLEFGQYPIETTDKKKILLASLSTVSDFDPLQYKPKNPEDAVSYNLKSVKGVLKQHLVAKYGISAQTWIVVPRDNSDITIEK